MVSYVELCLFLRNYLLHRTISFVTVPEPEAMIGVPLGAAKSVPLCILLYPNIGCFLIPKDEDRRAPLIGVFIVT